MHSVKRRPHSAADELLVRPDFDDGRWHTLRELQEFERILLTTRQANKSYSDAVRVDKSRSEKLRRDELVPFLYFAEHKKMVADTIFRKPIEESGVDLEYNSHGAIESLQITTAYPVWLDESGAPLHGGHQHRLCMEMLTANGLVVGAGPFVRREGKIVNYGGCNSWEEIEASHIAGLVETFDRKRLKISKGVSLLVQAVGYYQAIIEFERFHSIVQRAARTICPRGFDRVFVVDCGERFISEAGA